MCVCVRARVFCDDATQPIDRQTTTKTNDHRGKGRAGDLLRRASWMSLTMTVTRLEWMVQRLASSKSPTRCASAASCIASSADACQRYSRFVKCSCTSFTSRAKGSLRISSSVDRWYCRISFSALSPGRCRRLTPPTGQQQAIDSG